jgi:hypothetical protein
MMYASVVRSFIHFGIDGYMSVYDLALQGTFRSNIGTRNGRGWLNPVTRVLIGIVDGTVISVSNLKRL